MLSTIYQLLLYGIMTIGWIDSSPMYDMDRMNAQSLNNWSVMKVPDYYEVYLRTLRLLY